MIHILEENDKIINQRHIQTALNRISKKIKFYKEARSILIAAYITGVTPLELINIKSDDINNKGKYIIVNINNRDIIVNTDNIKLSKELLNYSKSVFSGKLLFPNFIGSYTKKCGGVEKTYKLRHYFKKWFIGVVPFVVTPYTLRHSMCIKMMKAGARDSQIKYIKGSKTYESLRPYLKYRKNVSMNSSRYIN